MVMQMQTSHQSLLELHTILSFVTCTLFDLVALSMFIPIVSGALWRRPGQDFSYAHLQERLVELARVR